MSAFKEQIDAHLAAAQAIVDISVAENRNLTPTEKTSYDAHFRKAEGLVNDQAKQTNLASLRSAGSDVMRMAHGSGQLGSTGHVSVNEPDIYTRNGQFSIFRDLAQSRYGRDEAATERVRSHLAYEAERRAIDSTDGTGGYAVAPAYLQNLYAELHTSAAPVLGRLQSRPLPSTDQIVIPKLDTGTEVARQADNAAIQNTDIADSKVTIDVFTIAGSQDISLQLFERSSFGSAIDQIIFRDLTKRLVIQKAAWVLDGTGTLQPTGFLRTAGISSATYTDASPTVPELWPVLASAVSQVASLNYAMPTSIVMTPSRWIWMLNARDADNRPLISTDGEGVNTLGSATAGAGAEGVVGRLFGVDVVVDGNMPTVGGASTNQDQILVGSLEQSYYFEGGIMLDVSHEEKFSNGTVVCRGREYVGFSALPYPLAISVISGTGLVTPAFA